MSALPARIELAGTAVATIGDDRIGVGDITELRDEAGGALPGSRLRAGLAFEGGRRELVEEGSLLSAGGAVWEVVSVRPGAPAAAGGGPVAQAGTVVLERRTGPPEDLARLPDLTGSDLRFSWDAHATRRLHLVRHGEHVLWTEPIALEDPEPVAAAARVLRARYGNRVRDIEPTPAATQALYGDSTAAAAAVERVRAALRGGGEIPDVRPRQVTPYVPPEAPAATPPAPAPVPAPRPAPGTATQPATAAQPAPAPAPGAPPPAPRLPFRELVNAVVRDDVDRIRGYLEAGGEAHRFDDEGETLLHIAARYRRAHIVHALLQAGAPASAVNQHGEQPADAAAAPAPTADPPAGDAAARDWIVSALGAAVSGATAAAVAPPVAAQAAAGLAVATIGERMGPVRALAITPDGTFVAAQDPLGVTVTEVSGSGWLTIPGATLIGMPDSGQVVVHHHWRSELQVVERATGTPLRVLRMPEWESLRGATVAGTLVAIVHAEIPDARRPVHPHRLAAGCWDTATGRPLWRQHMHGLGSDPRTARAALRFSAQRDVLFCVRHHTGGDAEAFAVGDGARVAWTCVSADHPKDRRMRLWNPLPTADGHVLDATVDRRGLELLGLRDLRRVRAAHGGARALQPLAVTADGAHAIAATETGDAQLWDLAAGCAVGVIGAREGAGDRVTCAAFDGSGRRLAAGTASGLLLTGELPVAR